MDCTDRITMQLAELILQPVRMLRDQSLLASVTTRALCQGARFTITVAKTWPRGFGQAPVYGWDVREVDETGVAKPAGFAATSAAVSAAYDDPEAAYWAAVEALAAGVASPSPAPMVGP